jgi:hypothetical protein
MRSLTWKVLAAMLFNSLGVTVMAQQAPPVIFPDRIVVYGIGGNSSDGGFANQIIQDLIPAPDGSTQTFALDGISASISASQNSVTATWTGAGFDPANVGFSGVSHYLYVALQGPPGTPFRITVSRSASATVTSLVPSSDPSCGASFLTAQSGLYGDYSNSQQTVAYLTPVGAFSDIGPDSFPIPFPPAFLYSDTLTLQGITYPQTYSYAGKTYSVAAALTIQAGPDGACVDSGFVSYGGSIAVNIQNCGDERDTIIAEYSQFNSIAAAKTVGSAVIPFDPVPSCNMFTQGYSNFNVNDFDPQLGGLTTWELLRAPAYNNFFNWENFYGAPLTITSAYRTPAYNASLTPHPGAPGSRHVIGDAIDVSNDAKTLANWLELQQTAQMAGWPWIEGQKSTYQCRCTLTKCDCVHADWRNLAGPYLQ